MRNIKIDLVSILMPLFILIIIGCNNGPKVIELSHGVEDEKFETGIFSDIHEDMNSSDFGDEIHTVLIKEVLPTERYVYLQVLENQNTFWIATAKQDIQIGQTYFYRGGLLKTNFESKEHNRIFDKIYLVSKIVSSDHSRAMPSLEAMDPSDKNGADEVMLKEKPKSDVSKTEAHASFSNQKNAASSIESVLRISDLVKNPEAYEGKLIKLSGTCVKLNPQIMGRNWIHLRDGSMDDYDLVITSDIPVQEGTKVTMQGSVSLNKDFGAGYKYDILVEGGVVSK